MQDPVESLKNEIRSKLDFAKFYETEGVKVKRRIGDSQLQAHCPFHDDIHCSFSINIMDGRWYCHTDSEGGDVFHFIQREHNVDFLGALNYLAQYLGLPEVKPKPSIPLEIIKEYHSNLMKNSKALSLLIDRRGVSIETIQRFQIGLNQELRRISIPIFNHKGELVNIRLWARQAQKSKDKIISYFTKTTTYGEVRIFGLDEIVNDSENSILLCEGEWDKIVASQEGFLSATATGGAGTWKSDFFNQYFKNREVWIVYDIDRAGQQGAQRVAKELSKVTQKIKIIILPLPGTKDEKDLSDYFIKFKAKKSDLEILIQQTEYYTPPEPDPEEIPQLPINLTSLTEIDNEKNIDRYVNVPLSVIGETEEAFHAVLSFKVIYCPEMEKDRCSQCDHEFFLPVGAKEYIESCMSTDAQVESMLRQRICPFNKRGIRIEITGKTTIREFFATQRARRFISIMNGDNLREELDGTPGSFIERKIYVRADRSIGPRNFIATGWVRTHPKTQMVTMLVDQLEPLEDEHEVYQSKEHLNLLKKMQKYSITEIIQYLGDEVLRVKARGDLIFGTLLSFHSPLRILFNREMTRGWLNLVVCGDTSTAKSKTVLGLSDYMKIGDITSGLTASRTGLTYGLKEHHLRGWQIKIGRYPANSRKILAVDELQMLAEEEIRTLGKAMDEGFFTVDRIADNKTFESMTRLIMMGNPKEDKMLDEFMFGCETLKKLFPKPILRRFDLGLFTSASDLEFKNLNEPNLDISNPEISPEMLRASVYLAWSRTPDQICFSSEVTQQVLDRSIQLTEIFGYAQDVPLVAPGDFRMKLARLSAALACLDLSTEDFETINVTKDHIDFIADFLLFVYSSDNCGLKEYAEQFRLKTQIDDAEYIEVKSKFEEIKALDRFGGRFEKMLYLLKINEHIRREDLAEQVGVPKNWIMGKINTLRRFNLVDSSNRGYYKKPKLIRFLRKLGRDPQSRLDIGPGSLRIESLLEGEEKEVPF